MKKLLLTLLTLGVCLTQSVIGQNDLVVKFKSGEKSYADNIEEFIASPSIANQEVINGYYYRYVQFEGVPTYEEQEELKGHGFQLLEYIPDFTYLIAFPSNIDVSILQSYSARAVFRPDTEDKQDLRIIDETWPAWADEGTSLKLEIMAHDQTNPATFRQLLSEQGINIDKGNFRFPVAFASVTKAEVQSLVGLPFVKFVDLGPDPGEPEDTGGRTLQRANVINNLLTGGRRIDGLGVGIQVRDDGVVGPHIDFEGRMFDFTGGSNTGTHGDGVAGVFAGAGNLEPNVEGGAKGADVYVTNYESSFTDITIDLHQNNGVKVTNSSYSNGCNAGYTATTQRVDQQVIDNPTLMHVFSAGNSNNNNCGYGAGTQWGNITGGHKQGKNVMATANLFADGSLVNSSSRGPAHDGRIKPDIAAHGQGERSTSTNNTYQTFGGTSSAAPTMAGSYTQLYQAYRDLNGGSDPNSGFLKAVVLNSAFDMGNVGPDFKFGWGRIDAYQGLKILENNQYESDDISQGQTNNHFIDVPAGVAELRVMIYWNDVPGAVSSSKALVNDLNMRVTDTGNAHHFPWILDPTPDPVTLDLPATTGVDDLNNMEQVSILNPSAGSHRVRVQGPVIPMGVQEYYVVWTFLYDELMMTYPLGNEGFVPGTTERLHWDAYGTSGTFTLEYSTDDGGSWNPIASGIAGTERLTNWTVPNTVTDEALVRVTRGAQSDVSDENFTIIGLPQNISVTESCQTGATITWNAVPNADEYNVYLLGEKYMEVDGTTAALEYSFEDLPPNETVWFSVQAVINGSPGLRANAVSHFTDPADPSCRNTLSFSKVASVTEANAGDTIMYTITMTSLYDNPINNIVITDFLDPTWKYIDGSLSCPGTVVDGVITIDSAVVNSDQSITCTFKVRSDILSATEELFFDDIESGDGNWTVDNLEGTSTFSITNSNSSSPVNSWFTPNEGDGNNTNAIILDPVMLGDGGELSFSHLYNTESGWDGGMVEISTNGGTSWTDLGPNMTQNGYNGGLGNGSNGTIANRSAFTGNSGGFIETVIDLSAFANTTAQFRFLYGEDDNTNVEGWYVDDVRIRDAFYMVNEACVTFDEGPMACTSSSLLMQECIENCDSCSDGVKNGDESLVDCGGSLCTACPCTQAGTTLVYDNTSIIDGTIERVKTSIEVTGITTTDNSSDVDLTVGNRLEILGEFETGTDAIFTVKIDDCEITPPKN